MPDCLILFQQEVQNLLCKERMGISSYCEPESRVLPATEAEIAQEAMLN